MMTVNIISRCAPKDVFVLRCFAFGNTVFVEYGRLLRGCPLCHGLLLDGDGGFEERHVVFKVSLPFLPRRVSLLYWVLCVVFGPKNSTRGEGSPVTPHCVNKKDTTVIQSMV